MLLEQSAKTASDTSLIIDFPSSLVSKFISGPLAFERVVLIIDHLVDQPLIEWSIEWSVE